MQYAGLQAFLQFTRFQMQESLQIIQIIDCLTHDLVRKAIQRKLKPVFFFALELQNYLPICMVCFWRDGALPFTTNVTISTSMNHI